ncbi:cyclic nucleotide-binding domain-containing protein [Neobacillus pocheonensis]|uniref:Crp/Fnr family transcriptional regulator n=1 Tax=Neobacillus pocheonensis TaxID=363869 RepID=UPI003D2AA51F
MQRVDYLEDLHFAVYKEVKSSELLRKIVIFKNLSEKSLRVIENQIQTLEFKKGEQVISEEQVAKGVYFVHSGAVKLSKQDETGNEIIVCVKQNGDVFAEACLFTQKTERYPATATMLQDGKLLFLEKQELEQELYKYP